MGSQFAEQNLTESFPELHQRDKKVKSGYWHMMLPISDWGCLADKLILHQSILFSTLDAAVSCLFLITLILPSNPNFMDTSGSMKNHLTQMLQENFSVSNLSEQWMGVIVSCLVAFFIFKIVSLYLIAIGRLTKEKSEFLMLAIAQSTTLLLSLFYVPILEIAVFSIKQNAYAFKVVAVVLLVFLPIYPILHYLATSDYEYSKRNRFEGRDYGLHTSRLLGTFALAIYCFATKEFNSFGSNVVNNLLHLVFALYLIQRFINKNAFLKFDWNCHIVAIGFSLHLVTVVLQIVLDFSNSEHHPKSTYIYMIVLIPLVWTLICKATQLRLHAIVLKNLTTKKQDVETSVYYLELLFHLFTCRQAKNEYWIALLQAIMLHTQDCADPLCMCFIIHDKYQYSLGPTYSLYTRELNHFFNLHSIGSVWNNLTTLGDRLSILYRKDQHNQFVTAKVNASTKRITISTDQGASAESHDSEWIHDFHSDENFKIMLATFYYSIYLKHKDKSDCFPIVDSLSRYLISEYGNQVSALSVLYEHVYSRQYTAQATALSDWKLQNLIAKARRLQMQQQEFSQKMANSRFNFAKVLEYRLRVEKMSESISQTILDKVHMYTDLSASEIDYLVVIKTGSKIFHATQSIQKDIEQLMRVSDKNFTLLREAAVFEMCVQEKPFLSDKLQKKLTAFLEDRQNKGDVSENSEKAKLSFSVYDSSNVVLFLTFEDNDYRCNSFTKNAVDLFGAPPEDIQGNTLTEFMPREVGTSHNRLVFDFLNGNSKARKSGKFNSFVISRHGKIKSAMVQPKLDAAFLDNVYIAGLAIPREKNKNPIVYTTHTGLVVGMNAKAHSILNHTLEEMGTNSPIFTTIPGLYKNYVEGYDQDEPDESKARSKHVEPNLQSQKLVTSPTQTQNSIAEKPAYQTQASVYLDTSEKALQVEVTPMQAYMFQIDKLFTSAIKVDNKTSNFSPLGSPLLGQIQQTTGEQNDPSERPLDHELVLEVPDLFETKKQNTVHFATDEHNSRVEIASALTKSNKKGGKKDGKKNSKKKQNMSYRANMTRLNVENLAHSTQDVVSVDDVLDKQRSLLGKKNVRVFKSSLSVENNRFQGKLLYKEVEIKGYLKSGATERSVLKLLSKAPPEILEEVLMSNPTCLSLYNKASLYIRIGQAIDVLLRKKSDSSSKAAKQTNLDVIPNQRERLRMNTDTTAGKQPVSKTPQLVVHKVPEEYSKPIMGRAPSMNTDLPPKYRDHYVLTPQGTFDLGDEEYNQDGGLLGSNNLGPLPISPIAKTKELNPRHIEKPGQEEGTHTTNDELVDTLQIKQKGSLSPLGEIGVVTALASSPIDVLLPKGNTALAVLRKKQKEFESKLFDVKQELFRIAKNPDAVEKVIEFICQARESEMSFMHTFTKQSSLRSQLMSVCGDPESLVSAESPNSVNIFDGANKIEGLLDELVANTEESSDEEPTDVRNTRMQNNGHPKQAEEKSHETKPMAPGQSTYAKSSRRDFTAISEAIFTRDSIENADKHLQYHKWTYVLLVAVILCFTMKTVFSLLLVSQNYKYATAAQSERKLAALKESVNYFGRYSSDLAVAKHLIRSSAPGSVAVTQDAVYSFLTSSRFIQHTDQLEELSREVQVARTLDIDIKNVSPMTKLEELLTVSEAVFRVRLQALQLTRFMQPQYKEEFLNLLGQPEGTSPVSFLETIRLEMATITEQICNSAFAYLSEAGTRKHTLWVVWWVLIILNLFGEVYSLVAYPTVIGKIILSIQHQTFRASEVLLRIDKSVFRNAVYKIAMQTATDETGNEESTVLNKAGSNLLRRSDFQNEASLKLANEMNGALQEGRESQDDGSVIMPVIGRKKQPRALAPKKHSAGRNDKKGYSVFINRVSPYSTAKTYTLTCSIVIFFDILYVAAWIYAFTTLSGLKLVMDNSVVFATAKASTSALGVSFNYQYLSKVGVSYPIFGKSISNQEASYFDFVTRAQNIRVDQYSDSLLYQTFCETALNAESPAMVSASRRQECIESLRIPQDTSVYQGMKEVESRLRGQKYLVDQSSGLDLTRNYYLSKSYVEDQRLMEFEISAMTKINNKIENFINDQSDRFASTYLVMLYVHIFSKVMLVCFFTWIWVPRRLDHWTWIRHTFLTLNNDILSNIYVKTYFVNEMGA